MFGLKVAKLSAGQVGESTVGGREFEEGPVRSDSLSSRDSFGRIDTERPWLGSCVANRSDSMSGVSPARTGGALCRDHFDDLHETRFLQSDFSIPRILVRDSQTVPPGWTGLVVLGLVWRRLVDRRPPISRRICDTYPVLLLH